MLVRGAGSMVQVLNRSKRRLPLLAHIVDNVGMGLRITNPLCANRIEMKYRVHHRLTQFPGAVVKGVTEL